MESDNALPKFSILIVDDEPRNIQLLGNLLAKQQYDIEFAMGGKQCFEWLRRKPLILFSWT